MKARVPAVGVSALAVTQVVRLDGVRQRRRQPGEQEPVDRQADQHDAVEDRVGQVGGDHAGDERDDRRPGRGSPRPAPAGATTGPGAPRRTGPSTENGSSTTASAVAIAAG